MNDALENSNSWRLDKKIPIVSIASVIVGLLVQSLIFTAWAAGYVSRTDLRIESLENRLEILSPTESRVVRLEQIAITTTGQLQRIEAKLDRAIERDRIQP